MLANRLIFLLLILPCLTLAQQKVYIHFDSNWQKAVTESMVMYTCECYKNEAGQYDGPFTCFDNVTDDVVKAYNFVDNKLDGKVEEFHKDGSLKLLASYHKGLPVGEWKEWDQFGELIVHRTFDENSRMLKDYFVEETLYNAAVGMSNIKEEPPIYSSKCILTRIKEEKYKCSNAALLEYYRNPPLPPEYLETRKGASYITKLKYELSDRGAVMDVEIIESSGDAFLDDLAQIHVLNMVPFESAMQYGTPINYWIEADIIFAF